MKKLLLVLVLMMVCLSGCQKEEPKKENSYDIAGKTYYNTVDVYGHEDHSKVWFGKDGSFVLNDSCSEGYNELSGSWSLEENVVSLNVEKSTFGAFGKLIFEIEDADTMKLKTTLSGSKSDDVFSINEIKGSTVTPSDPKDEGKGKEEKEESFVYTSYYNISQPSEKKSRVEIRSDHSFTFIDQNDFGISEYNGTYTIEKDMLKMKATDRSFDMKKKDDKTLILQNDVGVSATGDEFSSDYKEPVKPANIPCTALTSLYNNYWAYEGVKNYDLEVKATPADTTDKITYTVDDENVVKVNENGIATAIKAGTTKIHIKCGSIERVVGFETRSKDGGKYGKAGTFKAKMKDVYDEFQPNVQFDGKGNFVFTENCYAGMGQYKGTYVIDDYGYTLTVTDNKTMQGFAGDDVKTITLKKVDDKTLKLKTQLCMSGSGDLFYLLP